MDVEKASWAITGACLGTLIPAALAGLEGLRWWGIVWGIMVAGFTTIQLCKARR